MKDNFVTNMIKATIDNGGMSEQEKAFFKAKARKMWEQGKLNDKEVNAIYVIIDLINKKEVA